MAALVCVLWFEIFGLGFFVCVLRASFSAELRFTTFGLGSSSSIFKFSVSRIGVLRISKLQSYSVIHIRNSMFCVTTCLL